MMINLENLKKKQDDFAKELNIKIFNQNDFSFKQLLIKSKEAPDMVKLFGDFLYKYELAVLAGSTGVGKSILSYQIADGISKGKSILNQENHSEPLRVLYYDFELHLSNLKLRFKNYEANDNFFRPDLNDLFRKYNGEYNIDMIMEHIDKLSVDVVIVDNLMALALTSTANPDEALRLMKQLKGLTIEKKVTALVVCHTPKIKQFKELEITDIAGSALIGNTIDNAFMLGKSSQFNNRRYIKNVKFRNKAECDDCLIVDIINDDWLKFNYVDMDEEKNHLTQQDEQRKGKRKDELLSIALKIIDNRSIGYNDFAQKYADFYNKSFENGKKIIGQLIAYNIVIKDNNNKYIINQNEV